MSESSYVFRVAPLLWVPPVLCVLGVICQYSGLDEWLIAPFFDARDQSWPYKSHWLTSTVLHTGGKYLIVLFGVLIAGALLASFRNESLAVRRKDLLYILLGAASGIIIVALMKNSTHLYSPSKLIGYGGDKTHIRLFDSVPSGAPIGHAFPAGHASGAFSLVSVYFVLAVYGSRWRYGALAFALSLGFIFGLAQQARGKHFFSHDLFALAVCWTSGLAVLYLMGLVRTRRSMENAQ